MLEWHTWQAVVLLVQNSGIYFANNRGRFLHTLNFLVKLALLQSRGGRESFLSASVPSQMVLETCVHRSKADTSVSFHAVSLTMCIARNVDVLNVSPVACSCAAGRTSPR